MLRKLCFECREAFQVVGVSLLPNVLIERVGLVDAVLGPLRNAILELMHHQQHARFPETEESLRMSLPKRLFHGAYDLRSGARW